MEALSKDELLHILAAAKASSERDWLMCLVGFWHGLRASEVCGITASDVQDGHLTVARLKGSLKTIQPLIRHGNALLDEATGISEFLAARSFWAPNQKIFPITRQHFWRCVRRHAKTAGIPIRKGHPHIFKHSIAMHTIHSAGIENVRRYLGHKSIASTGAYLQVSDSAASSAIGAAAGALGPSESSE
jgi:site-specific recombinase XerD